MPMRGFRVDGQLSIAATGEGVANNAGLNVGTATDTLPGLGALL